MKPQMFKRVNYLAAVAYLQRVHGYVSIRNEDALEEDSTAKKAFAGLLDQSIEPTEDDLLFASCAILWAQTGGDAFSDLAGEVCLNSNSYIDRPNAVFAHLAEAYAHSEEGAPWASRRMLGLLGMVGETLEDRSAEVLYVQEVDTQWGKRNRVFCLMQGGVGSFFSSKSIAKDEVMVLRGMIKGFGKLEDGTPYTMLRKVQIHASLSDDLETLKAQEQPNALTSSGSGLKSEQDGQRGNQP